MFRSLDDPGLLRYSVGCAARVSCPAAMIMCPGKNDMMEIHERYQKESIIVAKHNTSDNAQRSYYYLHLTPDELAHISPAQLLQACLESRNLLQIILGILLSPDASPTERIVACDLI